MRAQQDLVQDEFEAGQGCRGHHAKLKCGSQNMDVVKHDDADRQHRRHTGR